MHNLSYQVLYFQVLYLYELLISSGDILVLEEYKQLRTSLTTRWISFEKGGASNHLLAKNQVASTDSGDLDVPLED